MRRLDIVIVNPGNRVENYQILGKQGLSAIEPPIWARLLASYCLIKGYGVEIIDANALDLVPSQVAQLIADTNPLLVVIIVFGHNPSASTQIMPDASRTCRAIKQLLPEQKIILVGGHVASLPKRTLTEEAADFVCNGEGPVTICELIQNLQSASPDYSKVHGLYYREDGVIKNNAPAPNVSDLDNEMSGHAWHLLPMDRYVAHNWHCLGFSNRQPYAALYTTLGCPYHCEFCCIQSPFKSGESVAGMKSGVNSYRFWSPRLIVDQIESLVKTYGIRHFKFADEMFVLNRMHVTAICREIIERGLGNYLNIWAYARVDTVRDDELVDLLKRAGFNWLGLGIESASETIRNDVKKGFSQDKIFKGVERVRKAGINIGANFMVGLPEDDLDSMQSTLDLALQLNCEWFNIYCAMAYPGSSLYKRAIHDGWPLPENWNGYAQLSADCLPLPTKYLSAGQVLAFRDYAFVRYFRDPFYLKMIREKFGETAFADITNMVDKNKILNRKHIDSELFRQLMAKL